MSALRTSLFSITPQAFWNWGRFVLASGLAFGLLIVVFLTWKAPGVLPYFLLMLLGGAGLWYLFRHPLLNLIVALAGFVLIVAHTEGINVLEVLYGLYYLGFLAHWFVTRVFLYREHVFQEPEEKALLIFLIGVTLMLPLSFLYGAPFGAAFSEWTALLFLFSYFPVKEAFVRYRTAPWWILGALCWVGLFVAVRNGLMYQQALGNAEMAWQIARGRVVMNDNLLMVFTTMSLVLVTFAGYRLRLLPALGFFLTIFTGLILTQSRGNWLAFLLGAFAMFLVIDRSSKRRLVGLALVGFACFVGSGLIFFSEYVHLIFAGLVDRFASLQTAATDDISLVNRFRETAAAWEHILRNPILGRGMGVPYAFFDLAHMATDRDAFIHNGYVSLWYRFGLWGLGLVLFIWARLAWRGLQAFRIQSGDTVARLYGLAAVGGLTALTLTTLTSNPFYLKDATFIFGILLGLAGGAYHRMRLRSHVSVAPAQS